MQLSKLGTHTRILVSIYFYLRTIFGVVGKSRGKLEC